MESFKFISNHILTIYLIIGIGVVAGKAKFLKEDVSISLSKILLNICLPLFIVSSFKYPFTNEILFNSVIVFVFGLVIHPLCYFLGIIIFRNKSEVKKKILTFSMMFSNCGYIGFPIIASIYGDIGIIYGSIFLAPYNIYLWTIGIFMFDDKLKVKSSFLNSGVFAVIIGLSIFIFQIQIPHFIDKGITSVGSMTTPLSMLIIGGILSKMKIKDIFKSKSIYILSLFRLLIIPMVVFFSLILLKVDEIIIGVSTVVIAMPVAITLPVLTQRYNSDTDFATKVVIISTMVVIVTIPMVVLFIEYFLKLYYI